MSQTAERRLEMKLAPKFTIVFVAAFVVKIAELGNAVTRMREQLAHPRNLR
jgi:hypothetical protein